MKPIVVSRKLVALLSVAVGLGLMATPFGVYAVDLRQMAGNAGSTATAIKAALALCFVAAGVGGVGYGLWQGFIARANDPQIKFGQSMLIAVGGGLLAAIAASTQSFQETVFGTTGNGDQASSSSPF